MCEEELEVSRTGRKDSRAFNSSLIMSSDVVEDGSAKEALAGSKVDHFYRIMEKIECLEKRVIEVAESLKTSSPGPKNGRVRKRNRRGMYGEQRSRLQIGGLPLQRVTSLDLLAKVVLQNSGEPRQRGGDNSPGKFAAGNTSANSTSGSSGLSEYMENGPTYSVSGDFGVCSSYAIFSPKGLEWIRSKSLNSELEISFLSGWYSHFLRQKKTENLFPVPLGLKPLPENAVLETLLDIFDRSGLQTVSFVPYQEVSEIYNKYQEGGIRSLRRSHCITLHVALALIVHFQQHYYKTHIEGVHRRVVEVVEDDAKLRELEDTFISNALFHYHQVSILPEGIDTLQAFLSLMAYTDFTGALHASYMMVTLAVRLAQDQGLHAEISYEGLPIQEVDRRKKIWGICRYFDSKLSLILGKPPVVANYDTSTSICTLSAPLDLLAQTTLAASTNHPTCGPSFAKDMYSLVVKETGFDKFGGYYFCRLIDIASSVYSHLYAPSATINPEKQYRNAQKLLKEMEIFRLSLPAGMRPLEALDNPSLTELLKSSDLPTSMSRLFIYNIQFTFCINLMYVQKAVFKIQTYMKERGLMNVETPFYESVKTAREVLLGALGLYDLNLSSYFRSFQWTINLAFFEIFVYALSKQEDATSFEEDVKLVARLHSAFANRFAPFESASLSDSLNVSLSTANLYNNFKFMVNILRKTFHSKFSREVPLSEQELKSLEYATPDSNLQDLESSKQSSLNPFIVNNMELLGVYGALNL
ncbi:LADA_0E14686g1_1 [Lachancea dasiensis]|uniref:LADA_0E14686g1_1 n=1 Tax=Lachancea dasiensis TaxID=1072105 RepID=A0A1G4JGB5_9SACH|nr:LADA_0E14686g1_1 [Lachancea dasiensis]